MSIKLKVLKNFSASVDGHSLYTEEFRKSIGVQLSNPYTISINVSGGKLNPSSVAGLDCMMGPKDLRAVADLLQEVAKAMEDCDC